MMFKIRKAYLRMAMYDFCFRQVHKYASMQDLENNNWIILDKLTNIYLKKICSLNGMTIQFLTTFEQHKLNDV